MATYKQLSIKNPEWDGPYWRRCRALYAGGKRLLKDPEVLRDVFPPHLNEKPHVYAERCKRAYYIPYAGEVIDMITSALFSEDIAMQSEPQADKWYDEWAKDVSPPGGSKQTLQAFLREQMSTALICKRAWTLIDLPTIDDVVQQALYAIKETAGSPAAAAYLTGGKEAAAAMIQPGSLLDQEKLGMLNAYACSLDPECVWDWECDRDGRLLWVLIHYTSSPRASIQTSRDVCVERWMYYTAETWERYEIAYKKTNPPTEATEVPLVASGSHSFGEVPVIRLELPDGLWAMGKIESIAVAHLNKRNALSWAEFKSLFPVLAHFAGPPDPMNPITEDPDRALNQTYGQGYIAQLGDKDKLEYVGPETGAYAIAAQDLKDLRDELHRVVHQMAQSVDNSAAALQRSAESKTVDAASTAIVLRELGKFVRDHAIHMHEMAQIGRQDASATTWTAQGMDGYQDASVDTVVAQAQTLELVSIPSATFQKEYKFQLARRVLGDSVDEAVLEQIKGDLDGTITNEQYLQPTPMDQFDLTQQETEAKVTAMKTKAVPPAKPAAKSKSKPKK